MATATVSKLPQNPRPIRAEPALLDAIARELRPYSGKHLERAQAAVQAVLASGFQGSWERLLEEFRQHIRQSVGAAAYRPATAKPAGPEDRAKLPPRGGALRLMPEVAAVLEELLAPFEGAELKRKQAAVLLLYNSGFAGSFDQLKRAYWAAIEAA